MNISKYYLSDYAKKYMFDRHRILGSPKVTSLGSLALCEPADSSTPLFRLGKELLIENSQLKSSFMRLQNKIIIGINIDEVMFNEQHNSLSIEFKDYSLSDYSEETPIKIFIDNLSLYGGIIKDENNSQISESREKYGQLKIGYNTLIIENIFSCQFIFDEVIENDLPDKLNLNTEGSPVQLNSINELKYVYPYYKDI